MSKRSNILVAVALLAIVGVVGCGGNDKATAPVVDTVAPAAVLDLQGTVRDLREAPAVALQWKAGPELDLAGYNVYRDGQFVGMAETSSYTDASVADGDHTYEVAAFDTSDNESPRAATSVRVGSQGGREDHSID